MPPIRTDSQNNEESNAGNNDTSTITSPFQRIPSFVDEEEDEEEEEGVSDCGLKRNQPEENEFGLLNRAQESQRKRGIDQESSGSPLRKKTSKHFDSTANNFNNKNSTSASWGARLRNLRNSISEHRRSSNFDAWSRSIWQLGSWWLEIAGEEAAGVVLELLEEFKREKARKRGDLVIPTVCGDTFLDNLLGKCLTLLGKNELALEVCKTTLTQIKEETDIEIITEIRFLQGCLSRALGKIPGAIESFEQVLKADPSHVEAHDHLYGFTCGLLPYKSRDPEEDALVQAYRKGKYLRIIDITMETLWTRWFGDETALVLLVSSLACTFDSGALYSIGQRSVNQRPDASVSWYCVGLFYQVTRRSDEARRYLFKAGIGSKMRKSGAVDAGIGPAWIALGHSFAAYGDHDQAVSAYVAAVKTHSPGSEDPSLFLAIEYLRVRQSTLAAAYLLDAHAANSSDPRVLNELACLQAGKENLVAAKKFLGKAMQLVGDGESLLPEEIRIPLALNFVIVSVKEAMNSVDFYEVKSVLDHCVDEILSPLLSSVRKSMARDPHSNPYNPLSLFPWTANSAHPSAFFQFIFTFCVIQEWRAMMVNDPGASIKFSESAFVGYKLLLECRNENRNLAMESVLIERQNRLLSAHSTLYSVSMKAGGSSDAVKPPVTTNNLPNLKTPRTPLIRSHSSAMVDSFSSSSSQSHVNNLSFISAGTPGNLSFSGGALPTASSIAASVSRRRLSLRRQMTGLRFDPADTSASFSSLESDNSFMSLGGPLTAVSSIHLNEDLMLTTPNNIVNQSMILIDGTDVEGDCDFGGGKLGDEEEDMQLDSDN